MAPRTKRDIDGDLVIAGNLTVLGGLNEKNFLKTKTDLASTQRRADSAITAAIAASQAAVAARDATYNYANNIAPTNNVTELAFTSEANADGSVDIGVSFKYTQGFVPAAGFLIYAKSGPTEPVNILASDQAAKFILASADAGEQTYGASLQALSVRYGGVGAVARIYHFAVVAVSQCVGGYIPSASGLVEDDGWTAKTFVATITDIAIKSYKGEGVNRRAIKIDAESLDWVDAPDTTPASSEVLQARIGRLGVGGAVLMDGDFYAPILSLWSKFNTISNSNCNDGRYAKTSDGSIWVTYMSLTGSSAYVKKLSSSGWGTPVSIPTAAYSPVLIESTDGSLMIFYISSSPFIVKYRVWNGSSWGSEISTGINVYNTTLLSVGVFDVGYIRIATLTPGSYLMAEYYGIGSSWVNTGTLSSASVTGADYITTDDGTLIIVYRTVSNIYYRIWNGSSWGAELSLCTTSSGGNPVLIKEVNGNISLFCAGYKFLWSGSDWSAPVTSGIPSASPTDIIQMNDGTWRLVENYTDESSDVVKESTLTLYAKIGTGIIERGSNSNGSYIKFGDGTLICTRNIEGYSGYTTNGGWVNFTMPYAMLSVLAVSGIAEPSTNWTALTQSCAPVTATGKGFTNAIAWGYFASSTTNQGMFNLSLFAIGRWKA